MKGISDVRELLDKGDQAAAEKLCLDLLAVNPSDRNVLAAHAFVKLKCGKPREAAGIYWKLLPADLSNPQIWNNLSAALQAANELAAARTAATISSALQAKVDSQRASSVSQSRMQHKGEVRPTAPEPTAEAEVLGSHAWSARIAAVSKLGLLSIKFMALVPYRMILGLRWILLGGRYRGIAAEVAKSSASLPGWNSGTEDILSIILKEHTGRLRQVEMRGRRMSGRVSPGDAVSIYGRSWTRGGVIRANAIATPSGVVRMLGKPMTSRLIGLVLNLIFFGVLGGLGLLIYFGVTG